MKAGSLFSGAGALDMAASGVLGCEPAWFVEQNAAGSKVLAHHWPSVPNHGDITQVDWTSVEPVEVLVGGFPCQDISNAGKRAGIEGERSGLWSYFADAIRVLRPRYVLVENVSALVVRGLDRVLADLAALGFDAEWAAVRASDVGAAHRRERIFLAAADPGRVPGEPRRFTASGQTAGGQPFGVPAGRGRAEVVPDSFGRGHDGRACLSQRGPLERVAVARGCEIADTDTDCDTPREERHREPLQSETDHEHDGYDAERLRVAAVDWREYGPAIRQHERLIGRRAPAPTIVGKRGGPKLSPRFTEWLMGWPEGHVTAVPGLSVNDQLRLCGNGVVTQQAAAAYRYLLSLLLADREVAA